MIAAGQDAAGCGAGAAAGSVSAGGRCVVVDAFDAVARGADVHRLPGVLCPLLLGLLVVGEGAEPLLVTADRLGKVGVLVVAADNIVPNHRAHASRLDKPRYRSSPLYRDS